MILWILACTTRADLQPADPGPLFEEPPIIESIEWSCDASQSEWSFDITTTHWTGGGWIWMGKSPTNAEAHRIRSIQAMADGSADRLLLTLDVEEDWRDASRGSSTRWLCSDIPELTFLATVYDSRAIDVEDCRAWGLNPSFWERVDSAHDCDKRLELPGSSDTGISN